MMQTDASLHNLRDVDGTIAEPQDAPFAARFWRVLPVTIIGIFLLSLPQLADPMVRHDDFVALMLRPDVYWPKTLSEGRWINWLWMERGVQTPAWANFAVYQVLFAILAAAISVLAFGRVGRLWPPVLLSLLIVVAPMATSISLWFNTLIPSMAILAAYAVLAIYGTQRTTVTLLPAFVVLSFLAYTNHPFLLLAICLCRSDARSWRDLATILALFVAGLITALMFTYTVNWIVHGVFGIVPADWRGATNAQQISDLADNLPLIVDMFLGFFSFISLQATPLALSYALIWAAAAFLLLRVARMEALYLLAGLGIGLTIVIAQTLKLGITVPERALFFVWVFLMILTARAADKALSLSLKRGLAAIVILVLLVGLNGSQTFQFYAHFSFWQADTREMAKALEDYPGAVVLSGSVARLPGAEALHDETALNYRLEYLTGRHIPVCDGAFAACEGVDPALTRHVLSLADWVEKGRF